MKFGESKGSNSIFYKCDTCVILDGRHTAIKNGNYNSGFKSGKPGPKGPGGEEGLSESERKMAEEAWKQIQKLPINVKRHLLKR